MKLSRIVSIAALAAFALSLGSFALRAEDKKMSAAELEKQKALQNPYPNDYGPKELPADYVGGLSKDAQEGYKLLTVRCAQCHSPARPLNSRFVEPDVAKEKKDSAAKEIKAKLGDDAIAWQVEGNVWERYVKRMMSKPGCKIEKAEGKKIWMFLVADGKRKTGANAAKWKAHRHELAEKLKKEKPERYKELEAQHDL